MYLRYIRIHISVMYLYLKYIIHRKGDLKMSLAKLVENYYNEVQLSLGDLNDRVDNLEIEIKSNSDKATASINKLTKAFQDLSK